MAWLLELTNLGRGLAITARVLVPGATSFKAATIAVASRPAVMSKPAIVLAMPLMAVVALSAFQEPLELLPVTLFVHVAKLALGSRIKLFVVLPLDQAIGETSKKNTFEVLGESLQHLVAEFALIADVLCVIRAMKRHLEPLSLKSGIELRMIPLG